MHRGGVSFWTCRPGEGRQPRKAGRLPARATNVLCLRRASDRNLRRITLLRGTRPSDFTSSGSGLRARVCFLLFFAV